MLIDQNTESLFKKSVKIQRQQEGACKDMNIALRKKKADTAAWTTETTENKEENINSKLDQAKSQLKIDVDTKINDEKTSDRETERDITSSNEVNNEDSSGRNVSGQVSLEALIDQPGISANIVAVTTVLEMDGQDGPPPPPLVSKSASLKEPSYTAQVNSGISREVSRDSTDLQKTDESSLGMESAKVQRESEPQSTFQNLGEGEGTETDEKSQTSSTESTKKDLTDLTVGTVKNTSHKVKSIRKRVRFNLEGNETSSTQPSNSTDEISKKESKIMFSDEEEEEDNDRSIDQDVSQRISRIQNLLRSDRLRTNRKRKYPVV